MATWTVRNSDEAKAYTTRLITEVCLRMSILFQFSLPTMIKTKPLQVEKYKKKKKSGAEAEAEAVL